MPQSAPAAAPAPAAQPVDPAPAATATVPAQPSAPSSFVPSLFNNLADPADLPTPTGHEYVIVSGDTLSEIAERYDVEGGWQQLWEDNRDVIEDPDLIYPGEKILIRR